MRVPGGDGLVVGNARALVQRLERFVQESEAVIETCRIAGAIKTQGRSDFEIASEGPFVLKIEAHFIIANMRG